MTLKSRWVIVTWNPGSLLRCADPEFTASKAFLFLARVLDRLSGCHWLELEPRCVFSCDLVSTDVSCGLMFVCHKLVSGAKTKEGEKEEKSPS